MDDSPSVAERVRVVVRVRPRNEREEQQESEASSSASTAFHVLKVDESIGQVYVCKKKSESASEVDRGLVCNYDRVFGSSASQQSVFEYLQDSVQQVAQGFNCTIFAYGQTGTGKTHTMLGKDIEKHIESLAPSGGSTSTSAANTNHDNWGVIPRAVESLFEELRAISRHGAAAVVYCSYMQIYNNEVFDLLQENRQRMKEPLAVREMIKGNGKQIYVSGLSEFRVANLDETLKLLKTGNRNRTIRATEYNEKSSRSHALLQISAEVESRGVEGATTIIRRAKLNLVDLAGSEKWAIDAAMGVERCKELTAINQSLSALGNVISALTNPKRTHIPYRDSKLTRLLQDSLGGNTRTVVIATISPSEFALDETISTLQFADRAKCVVVRVKVNEMVDDAILLARAQREIARLKVLLKQNASQQQVTELEDQVAKLQKENAALATENKKLRKKLAGAGNQGGGGAAGTGIESGVAFEHGRLRNQEPSVNRVHDKVEERVSTVAGDSSISTRKPKPARSHDPAKSHASLQLNKLRLDLTGLSPTAPPASDSKGKPRVLAAFVDESDEVRAQLNGVEREHEQLLRSIQTERRDLEQKLELLSHQQRIAAASNPASNSSDEDVCPMCGRNIDDHSDDELDLCIENEEQEVRRKQMSGAKTSDSGGAGDGGNQRELASPAKDGDDHELFQQVRAHPPEAHQGYTGMQGGSQAATLPGHKPDTAEPVATTTTTITPRRLSTSASGGRPSPYSQELGLKPSTPCSLQSKSKPFAKRRSLRDTTTNPGAADSGSSTRLVNPPSSSANCAIPPTTTENSNQLDSSPGAAANEIPILRQGHKSVKALKKFHAMSPYNLKLLKRSTTEKKAHSSSTAAAAAAAAAAGAQSESRSRSKENPNCPTPESANSKNPDFVTNSMRDIGLKLTVYKFRYDYWYPCMVVGYDGKRKLHCCQFEYGDKQWQDLKERKVQVVGRTGDPSDDED